LNGSADERLEPVFAQPPANGGGEIRSLAPPLPIASLAAPDEPILYADTSDTADLRNAAEAVAPLAELCALGKAQTPFLIAIVGPSGSGKSFALRRLTEALESLTEAAAKMPETPFLSRVLVATIDAAAISGDPATALASAAFAALERGRDGVSYTALADEAAHAGVDPQQAAAAAAERHDAIGRRLEQERAARDDVDAKRARLTEALLYETPGSRVDAFIRSNRSLIDARLRRFDLADGDAAANYRDLVRDLDAAGAATRATLVLRSIWGYRSQMRWLTLAVIAFALAFVLTQVDRPPVVDAVRGFGSLFVPMGDWLASHGDQLASAANVMVLLGALALLLTCWRAFGFSALLFRGLRLLRLDLRDRRRELDASAARLNQRVAALTAEGEAAAQHAAAMAKRAGAIKRNVRAPGPAFARGAETAATARSFFVELGRLMNAPAAGPAPAPQRLVFVFDNLDAVSPADGVRLIATANTMFGPGCAGVVACDPAALASASDGGESARRRMEKFFQVVFNATTLGLADGRRFAARLIGSNAVVSPLSRMDAANSALLEPIAPSEAALLTALAPLAASTPRGVKRFLNAYRLGRNAGAPKSAVALMLAVLLGGDEATKAAMRAALARGGENLADPAGSPALSEATQAARAANGGTISSSDAQAAWDAARRYALEG